jgi:hypothetical protein
LCGALLRGPLLLIQDLAVLRQTLFVLTNQLLLFRFGPALCVPWLLRIRRLLSSASAAFTLIAVLLIFLVFLPAAIALSLVSLSLGVGGHAKTEHGDGANPQRHARPIQ